jgi:hypothetical protein
MSSKSNFKNSRVHKLQLAKKIPEQLRGYFEIRRNGAYVGYAAIR